MFKAIRDFLSALAKLTCANSMSISTSFGDSKRQALLYEVRLEGGVTLFPSHM